MRLVRTITAANRAEILRAVEAAPLWSRITLQGPARTLEQNSLMWKLLAAFADQVEHFGRKYDDETWKCIAMHGLGKTMEFVPGLDGENGEIVGLGYRSSELDKEEMSNLIEFLYSEGARRGVVFHDERATA